MKLSCDRLPWSFCSSSASRSPRSSCSSWRQRSSRQGRTKRPRAAWRGFGCVGIRRYPKDSKRIVGCVFCFKFCRDWSRLELSNANKVIWYAHTLDLFCHWRWLKWWSTIQEAFQNAESVYIYIYNTHICNVYLYCIILIIWCNFK